MATIMRDVLTDGLVTDVGRSYAVVAVWGVVSGWLAVRALGRRQMSTTTEPVGAVPDRRRARGTVPAAPGCGQRPT